MIKKALCQKSYQQGKWLCKYTYDIQTAETSQKLVNTSTTLKPSVTKLMGNNAQNARTLTKLQS